VLQSRATAHSRDFLQDPTFCPVAQQGKAAAIFKCFLWASSSQSSICMKTNQQEAPVPQGRQGTHTSTSNEKKLILQGNIPVRFA
jgi:hypothetical protein